jgi:hypothetical protein
MTFAISLQNLLFISGITAALFSIRKIGFINIINFVINIIILGFIYAEVFTYTNSIILSILSVIIVRKIITSGITFSDVANVAKKVSYYSILGSIGMYFFICLNI